MCRWRPLVRRHAGHLVLLSCLSALAVTVVTNLVEFVQGDISTCIRCVCVCVCVCLPSLPKHDICETFHKH